VCVAAIAEVGIQISDVSQAITAELKAVGAHPMPYSPNRTHSCAPAWGEVAIGTPFPSVKRIQDAAVAAGIGVADVVRVSPSRALKADHDFQFCQVELVVARVKVGPSG